MPVTASGCYFDAYHLQPKPFVSDEFHHSAFLVTNQPSGHQAVEILILLLNCPHVNPISSLWTVRDNQLRSMEALPYNAEMICC